MSLLADVERACRKHGIPASTFGRRAIGDPRLVSNLRDGRRVGDKLAGRINAFIAGLEPRQDAAE